jgi:hypothetical protein
MSIRQVIAVENRAHIPLKAQPLRQGVPWPRGAVSPNDRLTAQDEKGRPIPIGWRSLNNWPDGSAQWTLLDCALDIEPSGKRQIEIEVVPAKEGRSVASDPVPEYPVAVESRADWIKVGNGLVELNVTAQAGQLIRAWKANGRPVCEPNGFDALIVDADGIRYSAAACDAKKIAVEDSNSLRATVRIEGRHQAADGRRLLDFWLRFSVTAGRADIRVTYNYRNYEKQEPGIVLRSMALELRSALPASAQRSIMHSCRTRDFRTEPYRLPEDFEIVASNTPDLEHYPETHQGITGGGMGRAFLRQAELLRDDPSRKPWFLRNVADFKFGSVFPPEWSVWSYLGLVSDAGSLVVAGGNMVGLHPKSLSIAGHLIRYGIWPEWAGAFEITQGEGRTLDFFVGPLPPTASDLQIIHQYLTWEFSIYGHHGMRSPVAVALDPAHVRRCGVFAVDKLPAYDPLNRFAFERKVRQAWTPDEAAPAVGHWHYGDLFHSWGVGANNEEMVGWMWFQEYLRSGRPECLERGLALAQHIADVDIVAYSNDPYQNGGMCAHGPRHNHCAAYPSHMWFAELLCAYALTGDAEFKRWAVRVCDCLTYWVNDPVGFGHICADGRESGQPLINLAWTYGFAPEERYWHAMHKIVRESFAAKIRTYGTLTYMKPREDLPLLKDDGYGAWAAWEGLYWAWDVTRNEEIKRLVLDQLADRLVESKMATHGSFRGMDYNAAAYAYYLSGDKQWLARVARPFRAAFRAAQWQFGWVKAMYYIKLAFDEGIVQDADVVLA